VTQRQAADVDEVLALYAKWGTDRYDEELDQLAHGLQTAALAEAAGARPALVAAALLHDVGHLLALARGARPGGDDRHAAAGARYLAAVFPPAITAPIALHVDAKRYRCTVDPTYHDVLSAASVRSLAAQGGPLTPAEAAAFGCRNGADEAVLLRGWDDAGKVVGLDVPALDQYRSLLFAVARRR
jgi:gamma-butyrobetaine dioxygenase